MIVRSIMDPVRRHCHPRNKRHTDEKVAAAANQLHWLDRVKRVGVYVCALVHSYVYAYLSSNWNELAGRNNCEKIQQVSC